MEIKTVLLDSMAISRALRRISHEIIENNKGVSNIVLLGIARGGIPICDLLAENIYNIENVKVPVGKLDITLYRDDLPNDLDEAKVTGSEIDFSITDNTGCVTGCFATKIVQQSSYGRIEVSNVLIFSAIVTISCLSNAINGRYTGKVQTAFVAIKLCIV